MKPAMYRCVTAALPLSLAALACGQLTGLSDDYQFDLDSGPTSATDGAGDGTTPDGPLVDAAAARDANACTAQAIATALATMSTTAATPQCKTCLASACCGDVETCTQSTECKNVLNCKLDCTDQGNQRAQCQSRCPNGGGTVPALYTSGVGACGGRSCKAECGFP